jgi:putative endonuclease
MVECADNTLYTGITTNVERRFIEHQKSKGGNYTRAHAVVRIVFTEKHPNRSSASKRESEIKSWSRSKKLEYVLAHQVKN